MSVSNRLRRLSTRMRPRRTRLFGLGLGRTGTTSLATMFGAYRTAHEEDEQIFLPIATDVVTGTVMADDHTVRRALRARNRELGLEVDVAQFLTPVAGTLAAMYADARFVVLVRDCYSWLDSRIEKLHDRIPNKRTVWRPWFDALFDDNGDGFAPEEAPLRAVGLRPVASYLRAWSAVTADVLDAVSADRLLVVRTEDLSTSIERLAAFAAVPEATLTATHANQARSRAGILAEVPADFVAARARELCGPLMERYWGSGWVDLADRLPSSA